MREKRTKGNVTSWNSKRGEKTKVATIEEKADKEAAGICQI